MCILFLVTFCLLSWLFHWRVRGRSASFIISRLTSCGYKRYLGDQMDVPGRTLRRWKKIRNKEQSSQAETTDDKVYSSQQQNGLLLMALKMKHKLTKEAVSDMLDILIYWLIKTLFHNLGTT